MSDFAHNQTDQILNQIEGRLRKEYKRAAKETQQKLNDFLNKYQEKDKLKKQEYREGKISWDEYRQWRKNQILTAKRWREMQKTLATDLHNVNKIAKSITQDYMPDVYALNHNYSTFQIEKGSRIDTSYTLYDRHTVERLFRENPKLLPDPSPNSKTGKLLAENKDLRWNRQRIQSELTQGLLQGESIPEIAKRMQKVTDSNYKSAVRNARTMATGAENAGRVDSYKRAEGVGIKMTQCWVATLDGRTRHSHRLLDGEEIEVGGTFSNGCRYPGDPNGSPSEVYNCFLPNTKIASDSEIVRSYKHKYKGKIISIKTAGGVQFSCTPNHPILTPNGWIAAELLNNGDNILVTFGEQNVFGGVNPDIKHRFPRIDAIHKFGKKMGGQRACGLSVNFHGDVATSNVEIVTQERLLGNVRYSSGRNGIDKFLFKLSNKTLSCFGSLFKHFRSVCETSFGFIGCKCKSLPFFKCSVSHSCEHGFGTIANRDSVLTEYSINDLPADTVIDGELLDRLSCKVFLDTIVNVDVSALSTHVYNLQTENGYYFVNSIVPQDTEKSNGIFAIAKNCRCTLISQLKGFETDITDMSVRRNEKLGNMTYDEWKKEKAKG